jgi:hypothetical protein
MAGEGLGVRQGTRARPRGCMRRCFQRAGAGLGLGDGGVAAVRGRGRGRGAGGVAAGRGRGQGPAVGLESATRGPDGTAGWTGGANRARCVLSLRLS